MAELDWGRLGYWLGFTLVVGLGTFHLVAGYYHLRYYVLRKDDPKSWKCQPDRFLSPKLQRRAALSSTTNLAYGGALTALLLFATEQGLISLPVYFDVADYGWPYLVFSTVLLFVLEDAIAFYVHWAMHHELLYKRFHRSHHTYVATTPYATIAIHPVVFIALQFASAIPILLIPFHVYSIAAVFIYIFVFNIIDHSGVNLESRLPWQASSNYHDDHHALFHVNFGQHLTIWDKLHGTLRRRGQTYGPAIFGGRGKSAEQDAHPGPFYEY